MSALIIEDSSPWSSPDPSSQLNSPIAAAEILQGVTLEHLTGKTLSEVKEHLKNLLAERVPVSVSVIVT